MNFITPNWPAPANVKAHTTVRTSWGQRKPHHALNSGNFTHTIHDYIAENNDIVSLLSLPTKPIWITQTHSTIAIEATPTNLEKTADASYTAQSNRVCAILTADCLPILICNQQGTHVAAAHAGWRGLAGGIIENTVKQLQQQPEDLLVWLGPAIGPEKFEVGRDVYNAFVQQHPAARHAFLPTASSNASDPTQPEKWLANLYDLARLRLNLLGIPSQQIYGGNYCTYTQNDLFFSYRRDKGHHGRLASVIWFEPK